MHPRETTTAGIVSETDHEFRRIINEKKLVSSSYAGLRKQITPSDTYLLHLLALHVSRADDCRSKQQRHCVRKM